MSELIAATAGDRRDDGVRPPKRLRGIEERKLLSIGSTASMVLLLTLHSFKSQPCHICDSLIYDGVDSCAQITTMRAIGAM